jgi:hypothetical protein
MTQTSDTPNPAQTPAALPVAAMDDERRKGWRVIGVVDGVVSMCSNDIEHCKACTESRGEVYRWSGHRWELVGNGTGGK